MRGQGLFLVPLIRCDLLERGNEKCKKLNFKNGMIKMTNGKKMCMITNGCPENRIDGARIQKFLAENGYTVKDDFQEADIIFFNACALTKRKQDLSIEKIRQIKLKKNPSAKLVVCGCLSKIAKEDLREVYQGPTFGSDEIEKLTEIIETKTDPKKAYANHLIPQVPMPSMRPDFRSIASPIVILKLLRKFYDPWKRPGACVVSPGTFYIKVSTGCLSNCSYCAVKLSRGTLNSKPIDRVINEFEEGLTKGCKEFALIGTDLGAYGRDTGTTLCALLKEMVKKKGDYKIKLRNVQPRFLIEMMPELIEILQYGKISYIGTAVESGNNRILKLMRRGYRIEDFRDAFLTISKKFPAIQLNTQAMVGFPSEGEEEFSDTVKLLDELPFDFVETYIFQPRPKTQAAQLKDQIPKKVADRRFFKLFVQSLFKQYNLLW